MEVGFVSAAVLGGAGVICYIIHYVRASNRTIDKVFVRINNK